MQGASKTADDLAVVVPQGTFGDRFKKGELPLPGDMLVARRFLKSRCSDGEKLYDVTSVYSGSVGLLLQTWRSGNQVRLQVLTEGSIMLFSHAAHCVTLNWERWLPT